MEKNQFIQVVTDSLKNYGFNKVLKTKYQWAKSEQGFQKIIYLYKSNYSNTYLMVYAFTFDKSVHDKNEFDLSAPVHDEDLGIDSDKLLDLDSGLSEEQRIGQLENLLLLLNQKCFEHITTPHDLYVELRKNQDEFMITYSVLERFKEHGFDITIFE